MNDRTGNQVREEGDEQRVADEILALCLALLQVHQVADLRKRKERDPQRKDDIPDSHARKVHAHAGSREAERSI